MPAASRRTPTTGQNVMPSPYGRQRPSSAVAPASERVEELAVSRDFPTPAGPDERHERRCAPLGRLRSKVSRSERELRFASDERRIETAVQPDAPGTTSSDPQA